MHFSLFCNIIQNMGTKITGVCNNRIEKFCEFETNREKDSSLLNKENEDPEKAKAGKGERFETFENQNPGWQKYDTIEKISRRLSEINTKLNNDLKKKGNFIPLTNFENKISNKIMQINIKLKDFQPNQEEIFHNKLNIYRPPIALNDQTFYKGQWSIDANRNGFGTYIKQNGDLYIGFWSNNKMNGRGRFIDSKGNTYEGNFSNTTAEGYGIYFKEDGTKYTGYWKNDMQEGEGTEYYVDGSASYHGEFKNGEKNGHGKFIWEDKSKYVGQFKNNVINGIGTYYWNDGREYIGQWENGKMHGKGIFSWSDGKKYEGDYLNDKKEGFGKYYWNVDKYYEGQWLNGVRHGEGTLFQNGKFYKGIWENGKMLKNDKSLIKNENISKISEDDNNFFKK